MKFEEYKLMRNSIQLTEVTLVSLQCELLYGEDNHITTTFERNVEIIDDRKANIYLRTTLEFEKDGQFTLSCIYAGRCVANKDIEKDEFERYLNSIVVPLLLPYARECVANTMTRMGLPSFELPTMDILMSDDINKSAQEGGV